MANDSDAGLIKRGFILLGVMALLGATVLFILFQGSGTSKVHKSDRAPDLAWSLVVPSAPFPASVSWAAVHEMSPFVASPVGWEIRLNAAATLARRGSDQVPWDLFREMLDLDRMTVNCREQYQEGQEPPEASARDLVMVGLKALADWHEKRRAAGKSDAPTGLTSIYEMVDRLADSPDTALREQARKTRATFFSP
jgi:hypothetical protein